MTHAQKLNARKLPDNQSYHKDMNLSGCQGLMHIYDKTLLTVPDLVCAFVLYLAGLGGA